MKCRDEFNYKLTDTLKDCVDLSYKELHKHMKIVANSAESEDFSTKKG